jgi:hypothetical protein
MSGTGATETTTVAPVQLGRDPTNVPTETPRRRSPWNLTRMGHGAPTVIQTLVDAANRLAEVSWPISLC